MGLPRGHRPLQDPRTDLQPVPGNEFHEVIVERNACLGIEDGRVVVSHEIGGHNLGARAGSQMGQ